MELFLLLALILTGVAALLGHTADSRDADHGLWPLAGSPDERSGR